MVKIPMRDTRLAVLESIQRQGGATVAVLAEELGISPISVRHHLTGLQAEGMIQVELQRQSIGRPRHIYRLSETAQGYFPNTYHVLAERLLDELKACMSAEQVVAIIDRMATHMAARYGTAGITGTLEVRLQKLVAILGEEGFRAAVRRVDNVTMLAELNCPYVYVGQRHPEVCRIDHTIIQSVLGRDVERTSCVLNGDRSCTFSVADDPAVTVR